MWPAVAARSRLWGTEITVELSRLPTRSSYQLWSIDSSGTWTSAATWGPSPDGIARVTVATATETERLVRVVVTSDDRSDVLVDAALWGLARLVTVLHYGAWLADRAL